MEDGRLHRFRLKIERTLRLNELSPPVRKAVVAIVGGTLLIIGVALIFLPGPAVVVIPLALVLLATEFAWARRCIDKAKQLFRQVKGSARL
jgi:hypothetical protein